jgi:hypothetical protein
MAERAIRYIADVVNDCGLNVAAQDPRISEVASALCLARTGVELDGHDLAHRLGDVAEFYGLDPDAIQAILHQNEPTLAEEWMP